MIIITRYLHSTKFENRVEYELLLDYLLLAICNIQKTKDIEQLQKF